MPENEVRINVEELKPLFEKYEQLSNLLRSGYLRKYHFRDVLGTSKAETDLVIEKLMTNGAIKMTPFGYKMLVKVQRELEREGLM